MTRLGSLVVLADHAAEYTPPAIAGSKPASAGTQHSQPARPRGLPELLAAKVARAVLRGRGAERRSAVMFQRAGVGSEISPTKEIADVLARVKAFPAVVESHPTAYEVEVATYDTVPLPLPTPEEEEDFGVALRDARDKKLRYLQTRNHLDFARQHPEFFVGLPADDVLLKASETYTKLISEVMRHGIELSTGRMQPPRLFDPTALVPALEKPATITLTKAPSVAVGTVRMPDMVSADTRAIEELYSCLDHGGSLRNCLAGTAFPTEDDVLVPIVLDRDVAEFLNMSVNGGLDVHWDPLDPETMSLSLNDSGFSDWTIDAQDPPAGTEVPAGSRVTVHLRGI